MFGLAVLEWKDTVVIQIRLSLKKVFGSGDGRGAERGMMSPDVRIGNNRNCCWADTVSPGFDSWSGPRASERLADARRPLLPKKRAERQHPNSFAAV